mgnify:CR=1 FL=1
MWVKAHGFHLRYGVLFYFCMREKNNTVEYGDVYVCGAGDAGQLGTGKRERELTPVHLSLISEKVTQVACGIFHMLILTGNKCIRSNNTQICE